MTPHLFLTALVAATLVVLIVNGVRSGRRRDAVRQLAGEWRMNFAALDTLQLSGRIAGRFPVPGVSALRVHNLIYGMDGENYRYYFTIDYTIGVTESSRRVSVVATYVEPRDRRRGGATALTLGDDQLPPLDQYRALAAERR
ncbi:hypothetical protein [Humisphaera borealis]|uniref:Uncharacterized protein n=1 Tax=Humisphaera borealis TaxID=2807512 RepID=A0A7M2X319_9BACT|nr:hypothetical protein [Humisphaera borealis]QOV91822.1 hypothetical protein IPV69_10900 [Humisphaera borealis]